MNTRGDTDKQRPPSRPNPHPWQGPAFLALGAGALAADVLLCSLDQTIDHDFTRGVYSILTGLFVVGLLGWVSIFNETRMRREASWEVRTVLTALKEQNARIEALADEVAKSRVTYLPPARQCDGQQRYMSTAVGRQGDTVPLMPTVAGRSGAVDQDALREQVEQVVAEELGTRESVRSQGYAEGYVDGVARRNDEDPPAN